MKAVYRHTFANLVAESLKSAYPDAILPAEYASAERLEQTIEAPKDSRMGWMALPVFKLAGVVRQKPQEISTRLANEINGLSRKFINGPVVTVEAVNGYLNLRVEPENLIHSVLTAVLTQHDKFGDSSSGGQRTILMEYSAPNIAKPFGMGHLRSTIIGHSLKRIYRKLGYQVIGMNYLGDWGTQFGKMIVAYRKWGLGNYSDRIPDIRELLDLYVKFHTEAEKDPSLEDAARAAFKELEDGQPEAVILWKKFQEISAAEFTRIYGYLGVDFDEVYGESFFNDKMDVVVDQFEKLGLTRVSEGATIVDLEHPQLPPALLRRSDGATLYMTRDLANLLYRWSRYHFEKCVYVVGVAQSDHFKQLFLTVKKYEDALRLPPEERFSDKATHVDFGWIKFGDKAMSTRQGNIVFLEDVIQEAVARVRAIIQDKNPALLADISVTEALEKHTVDAQIGVGAIIFSQLSVRRQKDVNFIWEQALNFEGETGPYLQYTHARLCSLIRHYGKPITPSMNPSQLNHEEELRVIEQLAEYGEAVAEAAQVNDPNVIANYLLKLSASFNKVYQRKDADGRVDKIVSDDPDRSAARMALVKGVQTVVGNGLFLLGLAAPEEM